MKKNNDKKIIAIIPARGGSKRLPGKNAYPVWGRPMLCWAIDACKESKYSIDVCVSSDCEKILSIAKAEGAITHNRSEESAGEGQALEDRCAGQDLEGTVSKSCCDARDWFIIFIFMKR